MLAACLLLIPGLAGTASSGQVYLTVDEALKLAFPKCAVERRSVYLTDEQRARASKLAGFAIERGVVHPYVATRGGEEVGVAWFDTHRVRTQRETVMVVVDPERRIARIELLAFAEPEEYVPRGNWYAQFVGHRLDRELDLKRGIRGVSGATLTARATTEAARRVLAVHEVVFPPPPPPPPGPDSGRGS